MAKKTAKEIIEALTAVSAAGVDNLDSLKAAVPLIIEAQKRSKLLQSSAQEIKEASDELSAMASAYAAAHLDSVFDEIDRQPGGIVKGTLKIDGKRYRFVNDFNGYERTEPGEEFDQEYLATLAEQGLAKSILELDQTEIYNRKLTAKDTAALGFVRKPNRVWSENP